MKKFEENAIPVFYLRHHRLNIVPNQLQGSASSELTRKAELCPGRRAAFSSQLSVSICCVQTGASFAVNKVTLFTSGITRRNLPPLSSRNPCWTLTGLP